MKIAGDTANISSSRVHVQRATEIKADASHCECGLRSTSLHRTEITSSQNTGETTTSLPAPLTHCDGRTQGTVSDKQPLRAPELTHTPTQSSRPSRFPDLRLASRHDSVNCEISGRNRPSHAVLPAGYLSSFAIALLIAVSPLRRAEHRGREGSGAGGVHRCPLGAAEPGPARGAGATGNTHRAGHSPIRAGWPHGHRAAPAPHALVPP